MISKRLQHHLKIRHNFGLKSLIFWENMETWTSKNTPLQNEKKEENINQTFFTYFVAFK